VSRPLVFGKYEIIRRLAIGGMGEIFLARQSGVAGFDRLVILKTLLPSIAADPQGVEMFLDEARVAATLNHPNIIQIYEVGIWQNTHIIAMEYVAGANLYELQQGGIARKLWFPIGCIARIMHDAALALDHAHQAADLNRRKLNIVHRDISPQNIMVTLEGTTKVVDFGIAKAANRGTRTETGMIKGKLRYMAPEQLVGEAIDGRSDQFALGVVFWEMLTGRRPFQGAKNDVAAAMQVLSTPIPRPSSFMPSIPSEIDAILARMLAPDRDERFSRCQDVADQLAEFLRQDPGAHRWGTSVGEVVEKLCGEAIRMRTLDLTPAEETFLAAAAPAFAEATTVDPLTSETVLAGVKTSTHVRTPTPAVRPLAVGPARGARRSGAMPVIAVLVVALLFLGGMYVLRKGGRSTPVATEPARTVEPIVEQAEIAPPLPPPAVEKQTTAEAPKEEAPKEPLKAEPKREIRAKRAAPAPQPALEKSVGFFSLNTKPWSKVVIDGAPHGSTPLFKVTLPPGRHEVRMINEEAGIDASRTIEIVAGETQKMNVTLK
jgi:serine/threonine-protein kinase